MNHQPKTIYFVSDMHFGIPDRTSSQIREEIFIKWLDAISEEASDLFIMGDMFDFWFEWKHVVPKGYIRLFGALAALSDKGIQLHFFTGNHDMWMFSYLQQELNANIYRKDTIVKLNGKKLYLSHGDGLGPGDRGYKFIKKLFRNRFAQWLYARMHPNFAVGLANFFSRTSRYSNKAKNAINIVREQRLTDNQEVYAKTVLTQQHIDFFIFGHQHTPCSRKVSETSILFNIGNWINDYTFLKMNNGNISHYTYKSGVMEEFSGLKNDD